ncbi:MAG: helix-turn-helix domain-containing protein, partial [Aurantimicrobium sp.]
MSILHSNNSLQATDYPAPAAFRAIQVLEVLSNHKGPMTLTEIAVAAPLPKSSALNLLVTLEATGMVRRSH